MKSTLTFLFLLSISFSIQAQSPTSRTIIVPRGAEINVSGIDQDFFPEILRVEQPFPGGIEKRDNSRDDNEPLDRPGQPPQNSSLPPLGLGNNFNANQFANGTPNDNDMAISNGGKLMSVINTTMYLYDVNTNTSSGTISYSAFTVPLGLLHNEFDPRVIYDPIADRFITVCINGYVDSTNNVIVGFSQTNDPAGNWNLYSLPGDALNNNLWTDYPIIALSQNELFITGNLLYNDSSWQAGFVESIVWQIKKEDGYQGNSLTTNLLNNFTFNGKPIRNLCPVKGGSTLYGPEIFLVSNRNFQAESDTIFLVQINDTIGGPNAGVDIKQLNSNASYFMAGDARQFGIHKFATNDSRVLGAFYENNKIQFVSNTQDTSSGFTAVYHGIITNPASPSPVVTGQIIGDTLLDFGFPNISYAGNSSTDHTAIITFNHTAPTVNAGCSGMKTDGLGNYSPLLRIKDGSSWVNVLSNNQERWGDYSGSQRRYNATGEVWMSGYYGYLASGQRRHGAYVAQVYLTEPVGFAPEEKPVDLRVYPVPADDLVQIEFRIEETRYLHFELLNVSGQLQSILLRDNVKPGTNIFSFSISDLPAGIYFLRIHDGTNDIATKKIIR